MSESDAVGLVLRFPQPSKPVSQNAWNSLMYGNGGSRHVASRERDAWKEAAFYAWKANRFGVLAAVLGQPCTVRVVLEFHENRTRDPHNYTGTICKWIVDGLVLAHVWPDDNPQWVSVAEPVLHVRNDKPKDATLTCAVEFVVRDDTH